MPLIALSTLMPPGGNEQQNEGLIAELFGKLKSRRKGISEEQEDDVQQPNKLEGVYDKISNMIPPPRSRSSSSVSSNSGNASDDEDWETDPDSVEQAFSGSQSLHRERRESPDSGIGSGATSPLHPVPEAKPLVQPGPAGLQPKPEAPPATTVTNEAEKPSDPSVKERCSMFGGMATRFEKSLLVK